MRLLPPQAITVRPSAAFSGSNALNAITLGTIDYQSGDGFSVSNGNLVCNFTGVVLVCGTVYLRANSNDATKQLFIYKNNSNSWTAAAGGTDTLNLVIAPFVISVNQGDTLSLKGRTWIDAATFTVSNTDNLTYLTAVKL